MSLEKETRKVFKQIHEGILKDKTASNRFRSMLTTAYLGVEDSFFHGKVCLDAGCGSHGGGIYNLFSLGAEKVYGLDVDSTFVEPVKKVLEDGGFNGKYQLDIGSVLELPYPDNFFDYVQCHGVLHHTADAKKGLREMHRVTKPHGIIYITIMGKGGLFHDLVFDYLRPRYKNDREFKKQVDSLRLEQIHKQLDWLIDNIKQETPEDKQGAQLLIGLKELINQDYILSWWDALQAPSYDRFTEEEVRGWFVECGCYDIERVSRYPVYKNIRVVLAPLYFHYYSELARLLYGEGVIQLRAYKK